MTYILGVNAGFGVFHDPAACLVDGHGRVLAFIEEERLNRVRHSPGVKAPALAVDRCLETAGIKAADVDAVAVGWDEPRMSDRHGTHWHYDSPRHLLSQLGFYERRLPDLQFVPHHQAHAASAFHASPYHQAAVLVVDGNGEDECISIYRARRGEPLVRLDRWPQVFSLGHLYEAASHWLGLGRRGAGKTMGLAAYGGGQDMPDPGWLTIGWDGLVSTLGTDTSQDYDATKDRWRKRIRRFAGAAGPAQPIGKLDTDPNAVKVAAAAQATVETVMSWMAGQARTMTGITHLCIAGGVGLNCAANGRLPGPLYVPPVPHDAGVALGAAWSLAAPREPTVFHAYTGGWPGPLPAGTDSATTHELDPDRVADLLADGRIVGVCRGRSEAGPRALCHRSFLASPVTAGMRQRMNSLKRREPWRPFGPVTHADPGLWEPAGHLERYMIGATRLTAKGAAAVPAVAHADGTTRPQRLDRGQEDFVATVLDALVQRGHPPVLLNTSLNGPGEPLVETTEQALRCARRLGADALVTDHALLLIKREQTAAAA
ncbi:carbamoyltransferase C-terminal domain-containing protein [Streptomyces xinghaiensis]|uniref:carbamoyltransferase C-terminal domain-containing protein n=1 Tax=Streptomyces xinghaiensis TaxID=1038928 RepID=UPI0002D3461F|nr:carbamoyltransferase C-terminal domain-containing protein [Streptomyces xinghaiensis]MZE76811.1 carbamoyltransferase [Streptomyces sp. SID5475]